MKTSIAVICMVVFSLVVFIPQASACSCAEPNIENSFTEEDNVIFSGKVISIKEQQRTYLVTFDLYQSWKGIPNDVTSINVMTFQSSATCGYNFSENQSYLVEAYGKWDQTPEAGICGVTTPLDSAHEQISFLNKQSQNDDTDFTAATFADKYQDLLQKGGVRVSVLIKVAGDVESTDPSKKAKEIRNLQSYLLKFLSYTNGINILSNPEKNEITGQIHPHWIKILEQRADVLSVTILNSSELSIDEILEKTKKFLDDNEFDKAIILRAAIDYTSKHVVVTISPEEFTEEHTAEYYEENLEDWIPFDSRIRVAKAAVAEDDRSFDFLDSVIVFSADFDLEIAFKVTSPDDCHGESRYGGAWEWIDGECIIADPPPDFKIIPHKYIFASPLKQIKAGVALADIQCNDGKNVVYKRDRMRAACVTEETENKLIFERGWASMRLGLPATEDHGRSLCDWFGGEWDNLPRQCHGLKYPLLCSMSGGDVIDGACFIPSTSGVAPVLE